MTEHKKRGRPPGSGKKKEVLASKVDFKPTTTAAYDGEKLTDLTIDEPVMVIPAKYFPSNWNEMGKVDKLKWLTEHRK
jgi:hypothetical protein